MAGEGRGWGVDVLIGTGICVDSDVLVIMGLCVFFVVGSASSELLQEVSTAIMKINKINLRMM